MKMKTIRIDIDGNEVIIEARNGRLHVSVPTDMSVVVNHKNAGIPGIIGPDIEVDCDAVVGSILETATRVADKSMLRGGISL